MKAGWTMSDIDGMDMIGCLKIRAWEARKEKKKNAPKKAYIDEIWHMEANVK